MYREEERQAGQSFTLLFGKECTFQNSIQHMKAVQATRREKKTRELTLILENYKLNRKKIISNTKWSSIAPLPTHSNTLLLHNAERERAQDRATEQGSGF